VAQTRGDDRIVDLTLLLRKSGSVREAKVLKGPTALREPAIRAATRRNYKDALRSWPFSNEIMVEVTFPKDTSGAPEIRQAMPAGVPGCVYASRVRISPEVMQTYLLEHTDPVYPQVNEKEGVLILRIHIEEDGSVSSVERVSGSDALAPAAIDAVKKWKYRPYGLNGAVVAVETSVELKSPN
jgi:TonB family protein